MFIKIFQYITSKSLMLLTGVSPNYAKIIVRNKMNKFSKPKVGNKYLFILSPPYCGSTLLNELISTSKNVSVNNPFGTREGQKLPKVKPIMNVKNLWDEDLMFDWSFIKKEWLKYWDISLPILLEKSPPNIMRTKEIIQFFKPAYFIIFYRNPYAHCESLINRNQWEVVEAAEFAIKCLNYQMQNIKNLQNSVVFSYETLVEHPEKTISLISEMLTELSDIDFTRNFYGNNFYGERMKLMNLNENKIAKLTKSEIMQINKVFSSNSQVLKYFNYSIII